MSNVPLSYNKGGANKLQYVDDLGNGVPTALYSSTGVRMDAVPSQPAVTSSDWTYATAAGAATITNTTTAVTIKGAAGASLYNSITQITVSADALGTATVLAIRDGAGGAIKWSVKLQTGGLPATNFTFPTPITGSANTLLEVVTLTASVTGGVYFSAVGTVVGP